MVFEQTRAQGMGQKPRRPRGGHQISKLIGNGREKTMNEVKHAMGRWPGEFQFGHIVVAVVCFVLDGRSCFPEMAP